MQHISYFVKVSETNRVLHLLSKCNTKMTPASQEIVSGEVLSEHVCRVLVSYHKVQSDLSIADFLVDIMEANINMLCWLLLDWVRSIKDCSLIIST